MERSIRIGDGTFLAAGLYLAKANGQSRDPRLAQRHNYVEGGSATLRERRRTL